MALMIGTQASDDLQGRRGDDEIRGRDGADRIHGNEGHDTLNGGDGADRLFGDDGGDGLSGGRGDDLLYGGLGNDKLQGGDGDDVLRGNGGADRLTSGAGADTMIGGGGDDIFVFRTQDVDGSINVIRDFVVGEDVIDLKALDANEEIILDQAFDFVQELTGQAGQVAAVFDLLSNTTHLLLDQDGDALADLELIVNGAVGESDLVL